MNKLRETYLTFLRGLKPIGLYEFIDKIKAIKEKDKDYFKEIGELLKQEIPQELIITFQEQEFIKLYYLDSQAKYIKEKLNLSQDLDILKTLVYCYNDNEREFNKAEDEKNLRDELLNKGFIEFEFLKYQEGEKSEEFYKRLEETYKPLNNLKVCCVFDRDKIGILGSFTNKEEHEGKLFYDEKQRVLFFMPKRHTRTGQMLRTNFYYKEIKK
jgi:hypothetical protein